MNFADPEGNVGFLELREGMNVADFGSGSGAHVFAMAERVGDNGKVYAVDVQKDLLTKLSQGAKEKSLGNIEVVWGDLDESLGSKISEGTLDLVLVANTLFQSENKDALAGEVYRVLKSDGRAAVIDWAESFGGIGPAAQDVVTKETAGEIFSKAGFKLSSEFPAGSHHYGLMFDK